MRRFEYAEIHLRTHGGSDCYGTKESWFAGLEQSTVDAILATATESIYRPPATPYDSGSNLFSPVPYMRLFTLSVLNVVGAVGWRVYQLAQSSNSLTWESYRLIREVGD